MTLGLQGVDELFEEMKRAPEVYRASPFWDQLGALGVRQLESGGLENFKRSVNMAYFNWGPLEILRHQFLSVLLHWCRHPHLSVFGARFPGRRSPTDRVADDLPAAPNFRRRLPVLASFGPVSAFVYKTYVAMLLDYVREIDALGLLDRLDEPSFGNPFLVHYRGRATSQDLCNSVHEFYSADAARAADRPGFAIAELGGGYGRLAYVSRRALPRATYTLVDIPPALNVAQEYLSRVSPGERIFQFRPFRRYAEVREEFEQASLRFLAAHQIELLPDKQFDLFVNTSSLHEMTWAQIENYLRQIDRLCRGRFYTKQWRKSQAKVNGFVIHEHDYPIPPSWRTVYHRRHPIQALFFEALYDVGA